MKTTEFRALIEQRQELKVKEINERLTGNSKKAEELQIKIEEIEKQISPEGAAEFEIENFFSIPEVLVEKNLKAYFKEKMNIDVEFFKYELINSKVNKYIKVKDVNYLINNRRDAPHNDFCYNLNCLHNWTGDFCWGTLLENYPEIKDVLWDIVIEYHNKQKIERVGLIKQMIKKNQEELEILTSPMKIERRITEICYQLDDGEKELKQLEQSLNEVEF